MSRRHISTTQRFRILTRDGFTCVYCGAKPPVAVLEVDHIRPVSQGGGNDDSNLNTSCFTCNHGKADTFVRGPLNLTELQDCIDEQTFIFCDPYITSLYGEPVV